MSKPRSLMVVATSAVLVLTPIGFELSKRKTAEAEGLVEQRYMDVGQYETIGYGQRLYGECDNLKPEECNLPKAQSEFALQLELYRIHKLLDATVKVSLNESQRAALSMFIYNVGDKAFKNSTLLKELNKGCYQCVPNELRKWINVRGKPNKGLKNRREKEIRVWVGSEK